LPRSLNNTALCASFFSPPSRLTNKDYIEQRPLEHCIPLNQCGDGEWHAYFRTQVLTVPRSGGYAIERNSR
jgi:hypothetical protein